jgi:alcohol dehydrogenase
VRAALYDAFGGPIRVCEVPEPETGAAGAVIRVAATGVCRSDYHGWRGLDPDIQLPHVPGHELAGEVAAVGPAVRNWKPGARVTVPFVVACGACTSCQADDQHLCDQQMQPGFTHWGSFAELVWIDHADVNLVELPLGLDFATAAGLGCRVTTAFRALVDQGRLVAGEWVAVHGCGGLGLAAVMIAKSLGARIVGIDIQKSALDRALGLGADAVIDAEAETDVPTAVRELTSGGAQLSMDALGHPKTLNDSILGLAKHGRHVQLGLMTGDDSNPRVPMSEIIHRELELRGSLGMQAHRFGALLSMIEEGRLDPSQLVGQTVTLAEGAAALEGMEHGADGGGITVINSI